MQRNEKKKRIHLLADACMNKQKPLLPSLKEKKRYLVYEVLSQKKHTHEDITTTIKTTIQWLIGTLGMAKAGIIFLDANTENKGIIRVTTKYVDHVKAAFCAVRNINKSEAIVRSVGLSGTLHKARLKFLQ